MLSRHHRLQMARPRHMVGGSGVCALRTGGSLLNLLFGVSSGLQIASSAARLTGPTISTTGPPITNVAAVPTHIPYAATLATVVNCPPSAKPPDMRRFSTAVVERLVRPMMDALILLQLRYLTSAPPARAQMAPCLQQAAGDIFGVLSRFLTAKGDVKAMRKVQLAQQALAQILAVDVMRWLNGGVQGGEGNLATNVQRFAQQYCATLEHTGSISSRIQGTFGAQSAQMKRCSQRVNQAWIQYLRRLLEVCQQYYIPSSAAVGAPAVASTSPGISKRQQKKLLKKQQKQPQQKPARFNVEAAYERLSKDHSNELACSLLSVTRQYSKIQSCADYRGGGGGGGKAQQRSQNRGQVLRNSDRLLG